MNVQDIDLNLLRVFDAVLHERGVTPAAARLGLTQPAVSNALARLRAVFNDPLFLRTPTGMDATPFARDAPLSVAMSPPTLFEPPRPPISTAATPWDSIQRIVAGGK